LFFDTASLSGGYVCRLNYAVLAAGFAFEAYVIWENNVINLQYESHKSKRRKL
jgi:hypothetical protein